MIRRLVDLQRIHETAMVVAGVRNASDDRNDDALNANTAVDAIDGTNKTRCVTRSQLQKVLVDAFFIVRVAVEEDIGDLIFFAALEDGFLAVFLIELLVLGAVAG